MAPREAHLLGLQRTAGNRAVADLVQGRATLGRRGQATRTGAASGALVARLIAGTEAAPEVVAHDHPDEAGAHELASDVMRRPDPVGRPTAPRTAVAGGLDPATRAFFEPRFGADLADVRVHEDPAAARSAGRFGAAAYTVGQDIVMGAGQRAGANAVTAHELAHVVRGDASGRLHRAPGAEPGFAIISQVWRVGGRDIVVVATGHGDQVLFFYRRTGLGSKGVGVAPKANSWVPFKTLMEHPKAKQAGKPWFNKNPYYTTVAADDPLRGYANTRNQKVGAWLDERGIPPATEAASWEKVERDMDRVAGQYRASVRGGGGPGGGTSHGGAGAKGGAAEAKAGGAEARATGAEAKALATEAKALKGEGAAVEVALDAAKAGRAARLGALLLELGLPGPWDVLFMFLSAFASIAEAKAKLRAEAYALGFAEGIAAVLTGTKADEATRLLMFRTANPGIGERVAGFEGTREQGTNDGVAAGFKFGQVMSSEQRQGFLATSIKEIKARNHTLTGTFGRDDLIEIGVSLRPTVIELLDEAQRQEAARLDRQRRERKDYVGNKI